METARNDDERKIIEYYLKNNELTETHFRVFSWARPDLLAEHLLKMLRTHKEKRDFRYEIHATDKKSLHKYLESYRKLGYDPSIEERKGKIDSYVYPYKLTVPYKKKFINVKSASKRAKKPSESESNKHGSKRSKSDDKS